MHNVIKDAVKKHKLGTTVDLFVTKKSTSNIFPENIDELKNSIPISVVCPDKDNKANKEVIKTLACFFDKPINNVFVVSGAKKNEKTVLIKGASVRYVSNKLRESLDGL